MIDFVTAIVTAYQRVDKTLNTLRKLTECDPPPAEILVHVDGNQAECATAIRSAFPRCVIIVSEENCGPGGGRNKLIAAARHPIVASFDDDSYPIDHDYFFRVAELFSRFSKATVLSAVIVHRDEVVPESDSGCRWAADFVGCGCAYRRDAFLETGGYVPLPLAYGMEEADLSLRLHASGNRVLTASRLRVFHDTDLSHHNSPGITAANIANIALLAYLRYPLEMLPIGIVQVLNRLVWQVTHRRFAGLIKGLSTIPRHLITHRKYRAVLPRAAVLSYLALRRSPIPVDVQESPNGLYFPKAAGTATETELTHDET